MLVNGAGFQTETLPTARRRPVLWLTGRVFVCRTGCKAGDQAPSFRRDPPRGATSPIRSRNLDIGRVRLELPNHPAPAVCRAANGNAKAADAPRSPAEAPRIGTAGGGPRRG